MSKLTGRNFEDFFMIASVLPRHPERWSPNQPNSCHNELLIKLLVPRKIFNEKNNHLCQNPSNKPINVAPVI
jgi:hypothetical protein